MINRDKAAQQAVEEVDVRLEGSSGASAVNKAREYVDQAISNLRVQSGGYNPDTLASDTALAAVVEYAKARLLGQEPENTASYRQAKKHWGKAAASEYHYQGHNID